MNDSTTPQTQITMTAVTSSQIEAIGYDASTRTLAIRFKGRNGKPGSLYHYANVDLDQFLSFSEAESVGSHFYKHIKPNPTAFPYTKITEPDQAASHD